MHEFKEADFYVENVKVSCYAHPSSLLYANYGCVAVCYYFVCLFWHLYEHVCPTLFWGILKISKFEFARLKSLQNSILHARLKYLKLNGRIEGPEI